MHCGLGPESRARSQWIPHVSRAEFQTVIYIHKLQASTILGLDSIVNANELQNIPTR